MARLVVKGYTQPNEIEYPETFSPTSKMNPPIILLSLVANYSWELQQFYVKYIFFSWKTRGRNLYGHTRI